MSSLEESLDYRITIPPWVTCGLPQPLPGLRLSQRVSSVVRGSVVPGKSIYIPKSEIIPAITRVLHHPFASSTIGTTIYIYAVPVRCKFRGCLAMHPFYIVFRMQCKRS